MGCTTCTIVMTVLASISVVLGIIFFIVMASTGGEIHNVDWIAEGAASFSVDIDDDEKCMADGRFGVMMKSTDCNKEMTTFTVSPPNSPLFANINCRLDLRTIGMERKPCGVLEKDDMCNDVEDTENKEIKDDNLQFMGYLSPMKVEGQEFVKGKYQVSNGNAMGSKMWCMDVCKEVGEGIGLFIAMMLFLVIALLFTVAGSICGCVACCMCAGMCGQGATPVAPAPVMQQPVGQAVQGQVIGVQQGQVVQAQVIQ